MGRLFSARMIVALFVVAIAGFVAMRSVPSAQEAQLNLSSAEVMRLALNEQVGKRVRLKLASGQDIEGQVARVGTHGVVLSRADRPGVLQRDGQPGGSRGRHRPRAGQVGPREPVRRAFTGRSRRSGRASFSLNSPVSLCDAALARFNARAAPRTRPRSAARFDPCSSTCARHRPPPLPCAGAPRDRSAARRRARPSRRSRRDRR